MTLRAWTLLIILAIIWGGAFFLAKVAVAEVHPLHLVFYRVFLAALTLYAVLFFLRLSHPVSLPLAASFVAMGILNNVIPFGLLFWGQVHIGAGLASILNATTPFFSVLIAHFATSDEKATLPGIAGLITGFCGVVLMIGPEALSGAGAGSLAQLACVGAAFSYGLASVFGRRFRGIHPMITATGQLSGSSLVMILIVILFVPAGFAAVPSPQITAAILTLAVVATAGAYILFFEILRTAGATSVALVTFLVPVSAITLGAVFLGERLSATDLQAMSLIAIGLVLIDGRALRRFQRRFQRRSEQK